MNIGKLKINPYSGLLMVDIKIWNKNKKKLDRLPITVDTGASVTTISTDVLFQAGYDVSSGRVVRITTASGIEYVKELIIQKMKLDVVELDDVLVYAHTFPQESFSTGVLGLNVLSCFDVNIQFSKGLISLTKI